MSDDFWRKWDTPEKFGRHGTRRKSVNMSSVRRTVLILSLAHVEDGEPLPSVDWLRKAVYPSRPVIQEALRWLNKKGYFETALSEMKSMSAAA